MKKYLFKEI